MVVMADDVTVVAIAVVKVNKNNASNGSLNAIWKPQLSYGSVNARNQLVVVVVVVVVEGDEATTDREMQWLVSVLDVLDGARPVAAIVCVVVLCSKCRM